MEVDTNLEDYSELIVDALVKGCMDEQETVSNHVCNIIVQYGSKHCSLVLATCLNYLQKDDGREVRVISKIKLMSSIERVCIEFLNKIDPNTRDSLTKFCITVINKDLEELTDYERYASGVIVCLSKNQTTDIMDKLLAQFEPHSSPPIGICKCLGSMATANPFGMMGYIKALLGSMVSMITVIRKDVVRIFFSDCVGQFAESIKEYLSNIDRAPDPAVNKSYFTAEIDALFEAFYHEWLNSRNNRVKESVIKAIGNMISLLSDKTFNEGVPRFINSLLPMYRRPTVSLPLSTNDFEIVYSSQSLHQALECIIERGSPNLTRPQMETIVNILFTQTCALPDYQQPNSIRNHNEILRSFATLNSKYSEYLIPWLLAKLESSSELAKIGSLTILKHLINASSQFIVPRLSAIFKSLRRILDEENNRVRRAITQVIVTIAHHGYLDLEGGQALIKYIITQCALEEESEEDLAIRRSSTDVDTVTNKDLRTMSDNVMNLLVTTVDDIERVLWPHLFEYLVQPEYTEALPTLCKSLNLMGEKIKRQDSTGRLLQSYFERISHSPKREALLARLSVIIGDVPEPHVKDSLHVLKLIGPHIHQNFSSMMPALDQLIAEINELEESRQETWRNNCCNFTTALLTKIGNMEFLGAYISSLIAQIHLYYQKPLLKNFYLINMGNAIRMLKNKEVANNALDITFDTIDHSSPLEREGIAYMAGKCAANHLDMVLVSLEKYAEPRRSTSLLHSIMDSMRNGTDPELERLRSTIVLSYAYVVKYAESELLLTRLETPILRTISTFYSQSKEWLVQAAYITAVNVIAHSVLPENLKQMYIFRKRDDLLDEMLTIFRAPSTPTHHCQLALLSISSLVKHEPVLSDREKQTVIDVVGRAVYCRVGYEELLKAFKRLLEDFIIRERSSLDILIFIVTQLKTWMNSQSNDGNRNDAIDTVHHVIEFYHENLDSWMTFLVAGSHRFESFGSLVGLIIARIFDPVPNIRLKAFMCLRTIFKIAEKVSNRPISPEPCLELLGRFINHREDNVPEFTSESIKTLTSYLAQQLKLRDLTPLPLFKFLLDGMTESLSVCSYGCSSTLLSLVDLYGNDIKLNLPDFISYIVQRMPYVTHTHTKRGLECIITSIGSHQLNALLNYLLDCSLIWSKDHIQLWLILVSDPTLCPVIIEKLLEVLNESQQVLPHPRKQNVMVASAKTLAAVGALQEIYGSTVSSPILISHFVKVFTSVFGTVANFLKAEYIPASEVDPIASSSNPLAPAPPPAPVAPSSRKNSSSKKEKDRSNVFPISIAVLTLKNVLYKCERDKVLNEKIFFLMEQEAEFPEAVTLLAKEMCIKYPADISSLVKDLTPFLQDTSPQRRLIPIAFFCEILSIDNYDQQTLAEPLLQTLLNMLTDSSNAIRKLCIRGLGRHSCLSPELNAKLSSPVISALLLGLEDKDDKNDDVLLESIKGLTNNLVYLEKSQLENLCVPIAIRLKSLFDKESKNIRSSAIHCYGKLCEKGGLLLQDVSTESLIPLVVYYNSNVPVVTEAARYALANYDSTASVQDPLGKFFAKVVSEKHFVEPTEFTPSLIKFIVSESKGLINDWITALQLYLRSNQDNIQAASIYILGHFFAFSDETMIAKRLKVK
ncbi:maestro heat-like repeat-containing protein family member 1 [Panonychus citri]|uniref:maestro heat-like repeat-containing protein family member 1 n=1 Tax=Panonychus citri TaxID=50023 RepID=UPI0023072B08|nr:maestro heat-like repeat-containing protein family member 1 [Panonychus citri]XP_053210689.1 maestro heat-like repeat-containing protein family member 1 [Panonychus citri]XP_053212318.1 maestro heat-like repeat-containing protein family member 1 [Panonychus citri]XP_053214048.1 maestro heat-like repeat-containing protein family member 1 [Panonychus citri]